MSAMDKTRVFQLQTLRRLSDLRKMISVQRLEHLSQSFMAVVFLIPHILVIHYFLISTHIFKHQAHQTVDCFSSRHEFWGVLLTELENDLFLRVRDNLSGECFG
jgi:hypothetical protein